MTILKERSTAPAAQPALPGQQSKIRERLCLAGLLLGTLVFYLINLSASGWGNGFYSAAAQAGSSSWKAWFFGASDAAGSITVDKPPAFLWIDGLSVRLFGLNSWSVLVPQVIEGVAAVWLLYVIVRRNFGATAAWMAGLLLALTPVAALMFRFNNPDALLLLLLLGATWAVLRGVEDGRVRWMIAAGVFVGLGFLTKQMQAFVVLPALVIGYLVYASIGLLRRVVNLLVALVAMVVAGGWWVAIVELWPASSRPYIGGSQDNSFLGLTFGYNGFGRLSGNEAGSVVPGGGMTGGGGSRWGETGIGRLFSSEMGGQIAWLLPAALILGVVAVAALRGRRQLTALVLLLTLLTTGVMFSFMSGIIHPYYTVALAPQIAGLVAIGGWTVANRWDRPWARIVAALSIIATAAMAWILLGRSPEFVPWVRWMVVALAVLAVAAIGVGELVRGARARRALMAAAVLAALTSGLAGPTAYAVHTIATAHTGALPSAGPHTSGGMFGRMGGGQGGPGGNWGGARGPGLQPAHGMPPGGPSRGPGRGGGFFGTSTPAAAVTAKLLEDADSYTWVAAAVTSNTAAGYQLATQKSVMPIGGFNGTDPSPTLAQFQKLVQQKKNPLLHGIQRWAGNVRPCHRRDRYRYHRVGRGDIHQGHGRRYHAL